MTVDDATLHLLPATPATPATLHFPPSTPRPPSRPALALLVPRTSHPETANTRWAMVGGAWRRVCAVYVNGCWLSAIGYWLLANDCIATSRYRPGLVSLGARARARFAAGITTRCSRRTRTHTRMGGFRLRIRILLFDAGRGTRESSGDGVARRALTRLASPVIGCVLARGWGCDCLLRVAYARREMQDARRKTLVVRCSPVTRPAFRKLPSPLSHPHSHSRFAPPLVLIIALTYLHTCTLSHFHI